MFRRLIPLLTSIWLMTTAGFFARVAFVWDQQRKIPHQVLASVPFDHEAGSIAASLVEGRGFSDVFRKPTGPTAWLPPVYPALLAGIFKIFGPFTYSSFLAAALLNCIFSAGATAPLFFAARRVAGLGTAALAAWLWAIYPAGVMLPFEWIWDTSLSALFAATLLWATLALRSSQKASYWVGYGVLWGFALLTNPALGILLPFFLLWLASRTAGRPVLHSLRRPALTASVALLLCAPWTLRNYSHFHRFIPIRSNLPFELWLGNNDIFDEHAVGGVQRITRFGEIRLYTQLGESAFMDQKRRLAWDFIRSHPALEFRLTARRIVATWLGTEHPWRDFLSADSALIRTIFLVNAFSALATLLGIAILFLRRNPHAIPVAMVPLLFPLIYYATHTSLRYRHPMDPVLLLLAAVVFSSIFGQRKVAPVSP